VPRLRAEGAVFPVHGKRLETPAATALPMSSEKFEAAVAGICASDDEAAEGVKRPVSDSALSELVVARVFVQRAGEDGGGHVGADAVCRRKVAP